MLQEHFYAAGQGALSCRLHLASLWSAQIVQAQLVLHWLRHLGASMPLESGA